VPADPTPPDRHPADSDFWRASSAHRHEVFAELRAQPVRWFEARTSDFDRPCTGFWALTRYEDVRRASRTPAVFRSGSGIDIEETPEELRAHLDTMITMDDPAHHRLRAIVSAAFTPRRVALLEHELRTAAREIVDDVLERFADGTPFDVVANLSARLPLRAISDLMGVPAADRGTLLDWTNAMVSPDDPAVGVAGAAAASTAMAEYATALGRERLDRPAADLTTALMHAEVEGERLGDREFANFFGLMLTAGNETTRNAISHGLRLLTEHPDQRRTWFADFDAISPTAVEEMLRYETPITNMARMTADDVEFDGVAIPAGSKVALWYVSANRDEAAFTDADRFDVRRPTLPPHASFGGGGPHHCLGAGLARREMTVMFDEIRRRLPTLEVVGPPRRPLSMGLNSIASMDVAIA
jgi:cytochrome P450